MSKDLQPELKQLHDLGLTVLELHGGTNGAQLVGSKDFFLKGVPSHPDANRPREFHHAAFNFSTHWQDRLSFLLAGKGYNWRYATLDVSPQGDQTIKGTLTVWNSGINHRVETVDIDKVRNGGSMVTKLRQMTGDVLVDCVLRKRRENRKQSSLQAGSD